MQKKMSVKEFRELGFLQEVNRLFLHPRGLALEVAVGDDGEMRFGEVWDCRESGIEFHPDDVNHGMVDFVEGAVLG